LPIIPEFLISFGQERFLKATVNNLLPFVYF